MKTQAFIELANLRLNVKIGSYGPDDVEPDGHTLDLTLEIDTSKVLIFQDEMKCVYDYDPLIKQIGKLASARKYETQEYLLTEIACLCASYSEIKAMEICLKKTPVCNGSGSLGVRIVLNETSVNDLRTRPELRQGEMD